MPFKINKKYYDSLLENIRGSDYSSQITYKIIKLFNLPEGCSLNSNLEITYYYDVYHEQAIDFRDYLRKFGLKINARKQPMTDAGWYGINYSIGLTTSNYSIGLTTSATTITNAWYDNSYYITNTWYRR